jgi:hypothetical protein
MKALVVTTDRWLSPSQSQYLDSIAIDLELCSDDITYLSTDTISSSKKFLFLQFAKALFFVFCNPQFISILINSLSPREFWKSWKTFSCDLARIAPGSVASPPPAFLYVLRHQITSAILSLIFLPLANYYDEMVTTCSYNTISKAFCIAFKTLSKTVSELQHGIIYPSHFSYQYCTLSKLSCPDVIFYWDSFSLKSLTAFAKDGGRLIPSSYFQNLRSYSYPRINFFLSDSPIVFYTLTYEIPVPRCIFDLIYNYSDKLSWIIRYHPMGPPPSYNSLENLAIQKNVYLDRTGDLNLLQCIANSSLHVSFSSSVVALCSAFNVHSVLSNPLAARYFEAYKDIVDIVPDDSLGLYINRFFTLDSSY